MAVVQAGEAVRLVQSRVHDGSSIIVTSEPKKNGTASIVTTQIGLLTPVANDRAREDWTATIERFLGTVSTA